MYDISLHQFWRIYSGQSCMRNAWKLNRRACIALFGDSCVYFLCSSLRLCKMGIFFFNRTLLWKPTFRCCVRYCHHGWHTQVAPLVVVLVVLCFSTNQNVLCQMLVFCQHCSPHSPLVVLLHGSGPHDLNTCAINANGSWSELCAHKRTKNEQL